MDDLKSEQILKEISNYVNKDVSFIDALVYYAEKYNLEVELIGEIVRRSPILKAKVRDDAEKFKLVEKTSKLPL
jgi:hypothetical protein